MTIVNNARQRSFWSARAHQAANRIEDLRNEITAALQQRVTVATMTTLVEADEDLAQAQALLAVADTKIATLQETRP